MAKSDCDFKGAVIVHRRGAPSSWICMLAALVNVLGGGLRAAIAAAPAASEYEIKAAFLLHFSRFVEWPPSAFASSDAPLFICVLGDDPFGPALEEIVRNERVNTHPITVERFRAAGNLDRCHILFVGQTAEPLQRRILEQVRGKSILTVSDEEAFTRRGGVIGFVTVNGKVKLQVNRSSAQRADLRISSRLLRLADEVG
jgi:hypothetical protein